MSDLYADETMVDLYVFETSQLLEQFEKTILSSEKTSYYTEDAINEIFRIMHTIKGSSAMMELSNIASLSHSVEDAFYFLRENKPENLDCSELTDYVLDSVDFIKTEMEKIKSGNPADGNADDLTEKIKSFLNTLKNGNAKLNSYKAVLFFEDGCEMENIRAYSVIHNLKEIASDLSYIPNDVAENDDSIIAIRKNGFCINFKSDYTYEKVREFLSHTIFLKELLLDSDEETTEKIVVSEVVPETVIEKVTENAPVQIVVEEKVKTPVVKETVKNSSTQQNIISVSVAKMDILMDLVGEMVIAESMVLQNPDLAGLELNNFTKAARQLKKITDEMQDMVMSIRMVPLLATFYKMQRLVRDMSQKLNKEVQLKILGEGTEVDKNIIEHISDPIMHLVRNAIDHGIESPEDRVAKGKKSEGTITLEAKNAGNDVLIIVKDDGMGLDKKKIYDKAFKNGLTTKTIEELSDITIFSFIFLPGFSTNDSVTEFSGRGVGMDVVTKNIEQIGGAVSIASSMNKGTVITLKIPLTLAIIDGMNIKVGESRYTIPTISIKESFKPVEKDIITDPDGNEMIMVRGRCHPVLRLYEYYNVENAVTNLTDGIFIEVEQDDGIICVFADELLGQQQVVVKVLPEYIKKHKKLHGISGCTLLGDGSISLILNVSGMIN